MKSNSPNYGLSGIANNPALQFNGSNLQMPQKTYGPKNTIKEKSYRSDTSAKRVSDRDPEIIQDAIANVHYWFNDFIQRNHEMVNKAYRILNAGADELKYAISLKTYSTGTVVALAGFIQDFKRSEFSKFIRLDVDIVPKSWEAGTDVRQIN